jgi:hypothetical protein
MHILRSFHAKRMALCLIMLGSLAVASGCGDENPVPSSGTAAPPPGALTGDKMKEARQKEFGTIGDPKSEKNQKK